MELQGERWCVDQRIQNEQLVLVSHEGRDSSCIFCRTSKCSGTLLSHLPAPRFVKNLIRQMMNVYSGNVLGRRILVNPVGIKV